MAPVKNAPTNQRGYNLEDRYRSAGAPVLLTGVQAIARLLVEQHELDRRAGRRTASFVSGYQGSPLGGVDRLLAGMPDVLAEHDITFVPGFNEEIAATAVWGSQAELPLGQRTHDGVVGVWYGKGPGVDRATDALRHANIYGMNPRGGALLLVGDDPASKSSTVPAVSERSLAALGIPVLFPRNASEIVELGLHGIAMSRASGCVVALKIVADVADGSWVVDDSVSRIDPVLSGVEWEGRSFEYRQRPMAVASDLIIPAEKELFGPRQKIVHAYLRENGLNVRTLDSPDARMGMVAAGTTYDSVVQGLRDLGLEDAELTDAGVRLMRLGAISPVESEAIKSFASGLEEILVVEDKTSFLETRIREILYDEPVRPAILGKKDRDGRPLVPFEGELTATRLLGPLRHVLQGRAAISVPRRSRIDLPLLTATRFPFFCSGCPHNRSTAVPEGSMAGGGIGCHIMVTTSGREDSAVVGLTQMGGEGAQWIGQAPFTSEQHLFQNVGDGTYFHSAQLAVQACIAAGVNITFKLLHNNVVAMTGAQDAQGAVGVVALSHKLQAEGVARIIICADEPRKYRRRTLSSITTLWPRDRLDEAQRALRQTPGTTVLIYDQHCAADARRQRKRGKMAPRNTRVVINEAVCEGCGDCGEKSNCLSVQPVETDYGRKTRIDQTSCNTDYSCLDGDCPSFMTVEIDPEPTAATPEPPVPPGLPDVELPPIDGSFDLFMAGIGGTGILTVNQVLATAALRAGLHVQGLDQTGLSQKAGPVTGHLRLARDVLEPSNRLTAGQANTLLGFDLLTAVMDKNLQFGDPDRTIAVASISQTPTGEMIYDASVEHPKTAELLERLGVAAQQVHAIDALGAAQVLFRETTPANLLVVGAAYQAGALPIPAWAVEEALEINGVAVEQNIAAFRWGRVAVGDPAAFSRVSESDSSGVELLGQELLAGYEFEGEVARVVASRVSDLIRFQRSETARDYLDVMQSVWQRERVLTERNDLSLEVARNLFKLTAYKDEYEVARLLTDRSVIRLVEREVPGGMRLAFKLHPPMLRAMGRSKKITMRPGSHWALRSLARLKFVRGTPLDVFGFAKVRRVERALRDHYRSMVLNLVECLDLDGYDEVTRLASLPDMVRGYEEIKLRSVHRYIEELEASGVSAKSLRGVLGSS